MGNERQQWASRSTFILAAVGSAVGLGNAWRFPGLAAKHGGGAFLFVYLFAMLVLGVPLLMMEISLGRKLKRGAPGSLRGINKKTEFIGWAATTNAFVISCYYAVVFAWVLLMGALSYKFAGLVGNSETASKIFENAIQTTWDVTGYKIVLPVLIAALVAWLLIYLCIKDGAHSVGKVIKYTVFLPVICLIILAIKGLTMPGGTDGLAKFFIPDFSVLSGAEIWVDSVGQVFFSLSIMMAVMFAYGSYLPEGTNIATDGLIIAFSDMAVSLLAGIVMFTTMGGVGMLDNMSTSGIATAFIIYPQAIVNLTNVGWANAVFGFIFYLCLVTLAIDSAFSLIEGVSAAIADKFRIAHKKSTIIICVIAAIISIIFTTQAGLAWVDIVDNWTNQYNMLIIGVLECIAVGWCFKASKVLEEINKNKINISIPGWWFNTSVKYIAPILLTGIFIWNFTRLVSSGGKYGYALWAEIAGGWAVSILVFISGFIIQLIANKSKNADLAENEVSWDTAE